MNICGESCGCKEESECQFSNIKTNTPIMEPTTQLTLGDLIKALEKIDKGLSVKFDFGYFRPNGIHSYRGYYEQLALGYTDEGHYPTVGDLLKELKAANGKVFDGYKGGRYKMSLKTPLWVDRYNNASGTGIVGVINREYQVIIETANID